MPVAETAVYYKSHFVSYTICTSKYNEFDCDSMADISSLFHRDINVDKKMFQWQMQFNLETLDS